MDAEAVQTRHDVARFIQDLLTEYRSNPAGCENATLPDFLEAMSAWIEDMDGWHANRGEQVPQQPTWQTFAHILAAATIYE